MTTFEQIDTAAKELARLSGEHGWSAMDEVERNAYRMRVKEGMTDIVERLRTPVMLHSNAAQTNAERKEAAAEIERLRAAFRVNMLRLDPTISHAEIDRILNGVEQIAPRCSRCGENHSPRCEQFISE